MNKTQISAEIVAHSLSPQGDELISVLCTFPRIILAEVNTHRMLSKNTSSSRAIPFKKMVESVQNDPFVPIAWQRTHSGMQGSEYFKNPVNLIEDWIKARDSAVFISKDLHDGSGVTKQLCNRLLEPFMWTTMLITGSKEGWDNFFNLRCPQYKIHQGTYKSKKEALQHGLSNGELKNWSDLDWLQNNEGQAEIHIMDLAEKIYDAVNESTPKQLKANQWHIPMIDKIPFVGNLTKNIDESNIFWKDYDEQNKVKISVALAARTSYTIVGDEKEIDYQKMVDLHDRLLSQDPPHSSPLEHCARAMSDEEYYSFIKGKVKTGYIDESEHQIFLSNKSHNWGDYSELGWCNNLKGFIPYRYFIDNNLI